MVGNFRVALWTYCDEEIGDFIDSNGLIYAEWFSRNSDQFFDWYKEPETGGDLTQLITKVTFMSELL